VGANLIACRFGLGRFACLLQPRTLGIERSLQCFGTGCMTGMGLANNAMFMAGNDRFSGIQNADANVGLKQIVM